MTTNFIKNYLLLILIGFTMSCKPAPETSPPDTAQETSNFSQAPDWVKDKNIYEVNLRQYTQEGTFAAFEKEVPRLKEMGVDILWFMPIHDIGEKNRKGSLGSYYAIKDYKSVNSEFGTKEDFDRLVKTIHDNDMYIIIDWVANHTAWDHPWTKSNPEYYSKDENDNFMPPANTDWEDVIDLDYNNPEVHTAMEDAMVYWVKEHDIDGFRCDVAELVPMEFWNNTRKSLDEIKPVFMLAEGEKVELYEAFDMTYAWNVFHTLVDLAGDREKNNDTLHGSVLEGVEGLPEGAFKMNFLTNHDENTWKGTIDSLLGPAHEAMAVLIHTIPGMPLIYSGQEANITQRLEFFERDPIDWGHYEKADFYTQLNALKHQNKALWNGEHGGSFKRLPNSKSEGIYAFERKKDRNRVITIVNLSDREMTYEFTDNKEGLKDYFSPGASEIGSSIKMQPWGYRVLTN
ncbi:alpha-amylase [Litoribacter ruber]|uniref:alpha-amylase family glycosyl hydrolase n=1 Tax=Litoribacter ruber TaxID=702568 RepID=UPI001BD97250|nr:alpha-amylase family glycosyl hydrolase [Litoribacter ruber]MBT0810586.1 alpha-amylase [Litoribacter ruber]